MFTQTLPVILIGVWLLAIALLVPYLLGQLKKKKSSAARINKKLNDLNKFLGAYESRLQIVRSHAIDYLNSLGSEGARIMSEIQAQVAKIHMLTEEVNRLRGMNTISALTKAEKILDGKSAIFVQESGAGDVASWEYRLDTDWQSQLEKLLQDLGGDVASASLTAKDAGVPAFGKQFKRETIHDLKEAGIDINEIRNTKPS
jgi:hypothetical protein